MAGGGTSQSPVDEEGQSFNCLLVGYYAKQPASAHKRLARAGLRRQRKRDFFLPPDSVNLPDRLQCTFCLMVRDNAARAL